MKSKQLNPKSSVESRHDQAGNVYIVALYFPSLALAAAIVSLFVYEILSAEGFVPGRESGLLITRGVAAAYVAVQLGYIAFVRLFLPTRDYAPMMLESIGQLSACTLLPFLIEMEIAWPHPLLERFQLFVFLGAFGVLHLIGKVVSFFAYTSGKPSGRVEAVAWGAIAFFAGQFAVGEFTQWQSDMEIARPTSTRDSAPLWAGDVQLDGLVIDEGAVVTRKMTRTGESSITFRWARARTSAADRFDGDSFNMITYLDGKETERIVHDIRLKDDGWTEIRIPAEEIPEDLERVRFWWSARNESPWQRILGVNPVVLSSRKLLVTGPQIHASRATETRPNLILIIVDGLGVANMSLGDEDATTQRIDRLASSGALFWYANAFTPIADADRAVETILNGRHPVRAERFKAEGAVTVPFKDAHYVTATFGLPESMYDAVEWRQRSPGDAADVLSDVRLWIDLRRDLGFAVAVRIQDLSNVERSGDSDAYAAKFDEVLKNLDGQLAAFVKYIRDYETRENTVVVIAGTHAGHIDPDSRYAEIPMSDPHLRVPLLLYVPGQTSDSRDDLVSLEDIAPTILALSEMISPEPMDGRPFLAGPNGREPVAVSVDRSTYSLRTREWRFTWSPGTDRVPELYDLTEWGMRRGPRNIASRFNAVVQRQKSAIERFLSRHDVPVVQTVETPSP